MLVTGATGFIGSHLCDLLALSHLRYKKFRGDILNNSDVQRNLRDIETIIHLASVTFQPLFFDIPDVVMNVNLGGTLNLLRHHKLFKRFIFMSSSHVYGGQKILPITEETQPNPMEPYSTFKLAGEWLVKNYADAYGFDHMILRSFNNFGPRQSERFVIPTFIVEALRNKKIIVKGNTKRDFLYVKDTVRALLALAITDKHRYNLYQTSSGSSYYMKEIADKIASFVGAEVGMIDNPRLTDIQVLEGTYKRVFEEFEWRPEYDMDTALAETVDYYRDKHNLG